MKQHKNIFITTNDTCNLRCTYCYENKLSKKEFDVEITKKRILEIISKQPQDSFVINFHGGEPFLVFHKIKELCEWVWNQKLNNTVSFFATTNGTLVHDSIQEWLYENRMRFTAGLSLDGNRKMQNQNRSNSFDLIDINFFVKTWPEQGVKMTVSPQSIETLADGIIFMHSVGIHNIIVNMAYLVNWSDIRFATIYQRELRKLSSFYKTHSNLKKDSIFDLSIPLLVSDKAKTKRWCGAGIESVAYDIDGSCYPCPLFFESVCGKEKSASWHSIDFSNPKEYISEECSKCQLYPTCPTCYGANYIERGNISNRDMNLCLLKKIRVFQVLRYEFDNLVNGKEEVNSCSREELMRRKDILDGIEKLFPLLKSIEQELIKIGIDVL